MNLLLSIDVDEKSRVPKYLQIVNSIIDNVKFGRLHLGQKMPSINEVSEEFYLSRDTVEKAYNTLKEQKVIVSVKGKGYYIAKTSLMAKTNVLFLINKLSSYKLRIFNSFVSELGPGGQVDLHIYHCDTDLFVNLLNKSLGHYDYYVIMPHFKSQDSKGKHLDLTPDALETIKKVPEDRLLLLDNVPNNLQSNFAVYQDFENDISDALQSGLKKIKKYQKLILVYPAKALYPYPFEIVNGFKKFCISNNLDFEILEEIYEGMELQVGDAFILIEESDLVSLIKQIREYSWQIGKQVGLISYNDTPLKELLGITCISTDFKKMGILAAQMVRSQKPYSYKNDFTFIDRFSI